MNNPKVIQEVYETEITGKYNVAVCPVISCSAVTGQVELVEDGVVLQANDIYKKLGAAEATPLFTLCC